MPTKGLPYETFRNGRFFRLNSRGKIQKMSELRGLMAYPLKLYTFLMKQQIRIWKIKKNISYYSRMDYNYNIPNSGTKKKSI